MSCRLPKLHTPVVPSARPALGFAFLALLSGLALPAQAQSYVVVYGRLNTALESVGSSHAAVDRRMTRETNNRSVLGFRGEEDLGAGLHALFQIEGSLAPDTGVGELANRDTRIGLSSPWGTAFLGVWGTPYLLSTSGLDPYYPTTAGYMSLMGNGSGPTVTNTSNRSSFDRRQQNSLQYWTPEWQGWSLRLALSPNEGDVGVAGSHPHLWSGALNYDDGTWTLSLAHELHRDYQGPGLDDSGTKLGLAYRWSVWRVALALEHLRYETATAVLSRDSAYVSATWQLGAGSLKLGFTQAGRGRGGAPARVGFIASGADTGARQTTLGYDYALSKRTTLYGYVSRIDNQARAAYDFAINPLGVAAGERPHVLALGLRHYF